MEVHKSYEYALQREHEGKRFFEQNAERFSHAAVVEAFQRLAGEEEQHICFIRSLLARLDAADSSGVEGEQALEAGDLFSRRAADALGVPDRARFRRVLRDGSRACRR